MKEELISKKRKRKRKESLPQRGLKCDKKMTLTAAFLIYGKGKETKLLEKA